MVSIKNLIRNLPISTRQLTIVVAVVLVVVAIALVVGLNTREAPGSSATVVVWGTDPKDIVEDLIEIYEGATPGVKVEYTEFPENGFHERVVRALAGGEGPDVFMVGNHDVPGSLSLLTPVDSQVMPVALFSSFFPRVTSQDFILEESVYAVPLYMDTLVLLYNREMFDQEGITFPPATWESFSNIISRLRRENAFGGIERAGAAIGGTEQNVRHAVDILNLLMLQRGAQMTSSRLNEATFAEGRAGEEAMQFYTQFANIGSRYYTWDASQPESIEGFISGKVAMIFGYQEDINEINRRSPFLDLGIGSMPQFSQDNRVDYASYKGLAVSRQSTIPDFAWNFAIFVATDQEAQRKYLIDTERAPALRQYINLNVKDPKFGVFARQALTARSWHIEDYDRIKTIFNTAIQGVLSGRFSPGEAIKQAEDMVNQLMRN